MKMSNYLRLILRPYTLSLLTSQCSDATGADPVVVHGTEYPEHYRSDTTQLGQELCQLIPEQCHVYVKKYFYKDLKKK